jgi:hypothetical protein
MWRAFKTFTDLFIQRYLPGVGDAIRGVRHSLERPVDRLPAFGQLFIVALVLALGIATWHLWRSRIENRASPGG